MPLVAGEAGVPQFMKQPGVTLDAGDIVGILSLDDPSRVHHALPFDGQLPAMGLPSVVGSKPHQRFAFLMSILHDILDGFDNASVMKATVEELIAVLRNPELPYGEAGAILSTLGGRIPAKLEAALRSTIEAAHTKAAEFPSARLSKLVDQHMAEHVREADRPAFLGSLAGLDGVIARYGRGLKSHMWLTLASLFRRYHATERLFSGRDDDVVLALRAEHKAELDKVIAIVLSHSRCGSKNALVLGLLEHVKSTASLAALETHFVDVLRELAELDSRPTRAVALKAREVLISAQLPSLEERSGQMEQILRAAIRQTYYGESREEMHAPSFDVLKELIDSRCVGRSARPVD